MNTLSLSPSWSNLLKIAWPLIIANAFWNLQLTVDRIFLGWYAPEALAAVLFVTGVFWVPMALLQQTSGYVTTFVAQYLGAGSSEKAGASLWQAIYVSVWGGLGFLALRFVSTLFFDWVNHGSVVRAMEIDYFNALTFSALPTALLAALGGFLIGLGKNKLVILLNFCGVVFNIFFDYAFIFGNWGFPEMGVRGAGYATSLAGIAAALVGLMVVFGKWGRSEFKLLTHWKVQPHLLKQFLKYGIPSGLQWAFEGLAFTVLFLLYGRMPNGDVGLAAASIAFTLLLVSVLPNIGLAQAVMTLVGQAMGSKRPDQAQAITWSAVRLSSLYVATVSSFFIFLPMFFIGWFKGDATSEIWPQVQSAAVPLVMITGLFTLFDGIYLMVSFALKGAGDTRFVSIVSLVLPWLLMVIPSYYLVELENGLLKSWLTLLVYCPILALILVLRFRSGVWKYLDITEH